MPGVKSRAFEPGVWEAVFGRSTDQNVCDLTSAAQVTAWVLRNVLLCGSERFIVQIPNGRCTVGFFLTTNQIKWNCKMLLSPTPQFMRLKRDHDVSHQGGLHFSIWKLLKRSRDSRLQKQIKRCFGEGVRTENAIALSWQLSKSSPQSRNGTCIQSN